MASSAAAAAADHTVSPILPRRTRQRRQSTVDGEDAELGALGLASELPAVWSQRAELDKQPVNKKDRHQVGSRVSCAATCFDSKQGLAKWSRQTFGEGGGATHVYGTVRELVDDVGERQNRKHSIHELRARTRTWHSCIGQGGGAPYTRRGVVC